MMVESALQFAGHSYRLWLVALAQQQHWQDAAAVLQRGILALCKPLAAANSQASGAMKPLPEAQAAAALDLALRLLHLLCCVGDANSRAALLAWAAGDPGSSSKPLASRSRAALLQALAPHPQLVCTLAISCAHAVVHGSLPMAIVHSLGYQPPPLSAQLQAWQPAPAALDEAASSASSAALSAGAAALGLLPGRDSPALQQAGKPLLSARCALLTTALRLGGAPLLCELLGVPHSTAALTAAQHCWSTGSEQPSHELLILVQEAAVATAAAAATFQHPGSSSSNNALAAAAVQGKLHPAALLALAAAVAGSGHLHAAETAGELLGSWAVAYERLVSCPVARVDRSPSHAAG